MKKLSTAILGTLLTLSLSHAQEMKCGAGKCGAGKCGSSMSKTKTDPKLLNKTHSSDGYEITINTKKPLVVGNNDVEVTLFKDNKKITDAKIKVKFFMPEMPGMPYMDYKEKLKFKGDNYKGVVNYSMGGTWQYHLKFKTADEKIHKVRGSITI